MFQKLIVVIVAMQSCATVNPTGSDTGDTGEIELVETEDTGEVLDTGTCEAELLFANHGPISGTMTAGMTSYPLLSVNTLWSTFCEGGTLEAIHYRFTGNLSAISTVHLTYIDANFNWRQIHAVPDMNGDLYLIGVEAVVGGAFYLDLYVDLDITAQPGDTLQATLVTTDLEIAVGESGELLDPAQIVPSSDIVGYVHTVQ